MTIVIPSWVIAALQFIGVATVIVFAIIGLLFLWSLRDAKFWF